MDFETLSKIEHPSVWIGDELFQRRDWQYHLTPDDLEQLRTAAASQSDLDSITKTSFALNGFSETLVDIQQALENESGATMIKGLPIDELLTDMAAKIYFGICQHLGTPVSQSATGERIFHVRDAGFAETDPRSRGPNTKKRLSFHTDRCDVIAFLCLRKAKSGGENFVVSSMAVFNRILETRPDLLNVLMQPFHYIRHTVDTGNQSPFCQQPIFSFTDDYFACSFLRVLIDRAHQSADLPDLTAVQVEALDYLESVCEDPELHVPFYQEPGDILLLNNWTTLHRRSEFVDHDEPELRRHLLRVWLSMPNSRPISPLFADNFGATASGAIRGGMRAQQS